jgi:predicted RNase H-like nuclease (RuvC/YqgF family)
MPSAHAAAPPVTATKFPSHPSQGKSDALTDPEAAVDGFVALVTNYVAHGGYEKLKSLLEERETLKKKLNDKKIANEEILESIASLKQDVKNNEQQLSRSKHEAEALTKELQDLRADNQKQNDALERARKDITEMVKKCKDKEAEVQQHQTSISELEKSTKEYAQEVEALKASLEAEKKSLSAQRDIIQALKGSLEQLESFSIQMVDCTTIQATGYVYLTLSSFIVSAYPPISCSQTNPQLFQTAMHR